MLEKILNMEASFKTGDSVKKALGGLPQNDSLRDRGEGTPGFNAKLRPPLPRMDAPQAKPNEECPCRGGVQRLGVTLASGPPFACGHGQTSRLPSFSEVQSCTREYESMIV